ncbi:MAG TPA: endonuclease domain-containing protein [Sphingomicrobium sp.]|nr:endonuclease domain-containing protein [Sphingomicrobium sp.]
MARFPEIVDRNAILMRARQLRRTPTYTETLLWRVLRDRPGGFKFRRQHPIGRYIADFYCPSTKLVIEIDGESHRMGDRPQRDARRDEWMRAQSLRILRLDAGDVVNDLESVVRAIIRACNR